MVVGMKEMHLTYTYRGTNFSLSCWLHVASGNFHSLCRVSIYLVLRRWNFQ